MARSCQPRLFLEGIERSFRELREEQWAWNWKKEGRRYEMAKNTNRAGPFVSLKVFDPKGKKFSFFVPRGRQKERWCEMAEILREMGVRTRIELQKGKVVESREEERKTWKVGAQMLKAAGQSFAEVLKQSRFHSKGAKAEIEEQESVKLLSQLDRCLVGSLNPFPLDLEEARKEMCKGCRLTSDLGLSDMGDGKVLLQFATKGDELRVLQKGSRSFKSFKVELCRWKTNNGSRFNHEEPKDLWVRLVGLPIHLWEPKILKKLGNAYEGFLAVNKSTKAFSFIHWARILVRVEGGRFPRVLEINMGRKRVEIQLWWEVPPVELLEMEVQSYSLGERREEDDDPRTKGSVGAGMSGPLPKILM